MTVLVLELMLPHSIAASLTNQELLNWLWHHVDDFVAYLLSFWMISIYWRSHFDFLCALRLFQRFIEYHFFTDTNPYHFSITNHEPLQQFTWTGFV